MGVDSRALHPSVRCGLETALLCAVTAMKRLSLHEVLSRPLATQNCVKSADPSAPTSSSGPNLAMDSPINARTGNSGTRDRQPGTHASSRFLNISPALWVMFPCGLFVEILAF